MDDSGGEELQPKPRPIEEVLPSAELLAHYKGRIGQSVTSAPLGCVLRHNTVVFGALPAQLVAATCCCLFTFPASRHSCLPADQFEQERDELLAAVDRCAVHRDDVHRLEWENRKRADEIKELQKVGWLVVD